MNVRPARYPGAMAKKFDRIASWVKSLGSGDWVSISFREEQLVPGGARRHAYLC
jgi:hypothetical protein